MSFLYAKISTNLCVQFMLVVFVQGFSVRMVDPYTGLQTNSSAGNIQIHTGGKWRFWDSVLFTTRQTRVACRELGFIRPLNFQTMYNLTNVIGNVVTNENIKCVGTENKLSDCFHGNWKLSNKTNDFSLVWVWCERFPPPLKCDMKPIKIVRKEYVHSGKVAIKSNGKWEILHVKHWNKELGHLACIDLGFPGLIKNLHSQEYHGYRDYNNFDCQNIKDKLMCCPTKPKYRNVFPSILEVAVVCEPDIRNNYLLQEPLQIYRNMTWYQVCGETWSLANTRVVCRELGYTRDSEINHFFTNNTNNTKTWTKDIDCTGKEKSLRKCHLRYRPSSQCRRFVYVQCKGDEIRLNGFNSHQAGRIEVLYKGIWGTLNSRKNAFGYPEAKVACRQLGYNDAFRSLNHNEVPSVSRGIIWSKQIKCNGNESRLQDCSWIQGDYRFIRHDLNSGVICKMNIRLADSPNENEGKLEVYHNNSWKRVCAKHWTMTEANVICHKLGYSKAVDFKKSLRSCFNKSMEYLKIKINCTGQGKDFYNCFQVEDTKVHCDKGSVHVRCVGKEGDLRLVEMKTRFFIDELQIMHHGIWGHVAGENWTLQNTEVVCRQLNKPGVKRFRLIKTKATSQAQILWLKGVHCKGNETKLIDCPKRPWLHSKKESVSEWKVSVECNNDLRFKSEGGLNQGELQQFFNGVWLPICTKHKLKKILVTKYCQRMGYADGIQIFNFTVDRNTTTCQNGTELHIRCHIKQFRLRSTGIKSNSGIVEYLDKNKWVAIYYYKLKLQDAVNICNYLGYPNVSRRWLCRAKTARLHGAIIKWKRSGIYYKTYRGASFKSAGLTCKK